VYQQFFSFYYFSEIKEVLKFGKFFSKNFFCSSVDKKVLGQNDIFARVVLRATGHFSATFVESASISK